MASADGARVRADAYVSIAYELYDQHGQLVDLVKRDQPLSYVHGYAAIIPGLDAGLEGALEGDQRTLQLGPAEAFGERDPAGVLEVERDELAGDVAVGDEVIAVGPDGLEVAWQVSELSDDIVLIDTNHPLAGAEVRFEVTVCGVRPATDQEIALARAELDERIVGDATIGYQSDLKHEPQLRAETLIQLRDKEKS
jgi:FKBP-type peptidyl-prolyl cis-trans isomerase SlyD